MKFCIFLLNFINVFGYILNSPINSYKRIYNDQVIKVYEPINMEKKDMNAIIFYTGANSLMPGDIYSSFIQTLNNYNFSVSVVTNDNSVTKELLYDTRDEYKNIIPLTHSSGYVNALKTINSQKNIRKAVFLDPVDNNDLLNFNILSFGNNNKFKHLEKVLVLNAEKSYKWSLFPKFEIPFIPAFALNLKEFEKVNSELNLEKIKADSYGHSDVLDSLWSDLMHATLSKGNENRDSEIMIEYHNWLTEQIYNFVNDKKDEEELEEENIINAEIVYSSPVDYEYPIN